MQHTICHCFYEDIFEAQEVNLSLVLHPRGVLISAHGPACSKIRTFFPALSSPYAVSAVRLPDTPGHPPHHGL